MDYSIDQSSLVVFELNSVPRPGGNFGEIAKAWHELRTTANSARGVYRDKLKSLERYADDDPHATADRREARKSFENVVTAAQNRARGPMLKALSSIEKAAASHAAEAPSSEQLRQLQTLQMRVSVTREELAEYERAMCDAPQAYAALRDIARERFAMELEGEAVPDAEIRAAAVEGVKSAIFSMLKYRGGTRSQLVSEEFDRRHAARWGGGDADGSALLDLDRYGSDVADVEGRHVGAMVSAILPGVPDRVIRQLDGE